MEISSEKLIVKINSCARAGFGAVAALQEIWKFQNFDQITLGEIYKLRISWKLEILLNFLHKQENKPKFQLGMRAGVPSLPLDSRILSWFQ